MGAHGCILFSGACFCIAVMLLPCKEQGKFKSTKRRRSSRKANVLKLLSFSPHFSILFPSELCLFVSFVFVCLG